MEITAREFGRLEACCFALEEMAEKNPVTLRLVQLFHEVLEDVELTAVPGEAEPLPDWCGTTPSTSDKSDRSDKSDVRSYGQSIAEGCTPRELVRSVQREFGLSQNAVARLIGVNSGSLSRFLNKGERRDAVLAGLAAFFGAERRPRNVAPASPGGLDRECGTTPEASDKSDKIRQPQSAVMSMGEAQRSNGAAGAPPKVPGARAAGEPAHVQAKATFGGSQEVK